VAVTLHNEGTGMEPLQIGHQELYGRGGNINNCHTCHGIVLLQIIWDVRVHAGCMAAVLSNHWQLQS
jgi:hypothetical protein